MSPRDANSDVDSRSDVVHNVELASGLPWRRQERAAQHSRPGLPLRSATASSSHSHEVPDIAAASSSTSASRSIKARRTPQTPRAVVTNWSTLKIETALLGFSQELARDHARMVHFTLESMCNKVPQQRRHVSSVDAFAGLDTLTAAEDLSGPTIKIRLKQYGHEHRKKQERAKHETRSVIYQLACITTDQVAVPRYRFHHTEISRNILSGDVPLKFIPHLKDLQDGSKDDEELQKWTQELESMDQKSGFDTSKWANKASKTRTAECMKTLSLYLKRWIQRAPSPRLRRL